MFDTQAGDCDYEADCDELERPPWNIGRALGQRLAQARRVYL
jgi:hypothetical protein